MMYLRQKHSQIIILSFLISSVLLISYSRIDIEIADVFFNQGFYLTKTWWESLLYASVKYFLSISFVTIIGVYLVNKIMKKSILGIDGRKAAYFLLVLIIGAGIIVNATFKNQFGRARPRDIVEFNGDKHFTPAFEITNQCDKNCSFSSGHAAGAFFALAIAYTCRRRKSIFVIAMLYGGLVSFSRIASGAHFFSDNVISFFIMLITADILYYYFLHNRSESPDDEEPDAAYASRQS